jgi:hypothetical protein
MVCRSRLSPVVLEGCWGPQGSVGQSCTPQLQLTVVSPGVDGTAVSLVVGELPSAVMVEVPLASTAGTRGRGWGVETTLATGAAAATGVAAKS